MKLPVLAFAMGATAFGSLSAYAQTTTVIEERRAPAVVIEQQTPVTSSTTVEKSEPVLGGVKNTTRIETTGAGVDCSTKVEKTDTLLGSKTVRKQDCY
jgi:hypothetical protein